MDRPWSWIARGHFDLPLRKVMDRPRMHQGRLYEEPPAPREEKKQISMSPGGVRRLWSKLNGEAIYMLRWTVAWYP